LKALQRYRRSRKVISSSNTNIKEREKNLPSFDLRFGYMFCPEREEKKQKKERAVNEKHNSAYVNLIQL